MTYAARYGALGVLLALCTACSDSTPPTRPSPVNAPVTTPAPPPPPVAHNPTFPALARPGRVYMGVSSPTSPTHGSALYSRYVLYDDGTFALQYSSANFPFFEYRGTYSGSGEAIEFLFEGFGTSRGTLVDESLTVKYNDIMQMSDFEDGVYVRQQ